MFHLELRSPPRHEAFKVNKCNCYRHPGGESSTARASSGLSPGPFLVATPTISPQSLIPFADCSVHGELGKMSLFKSIASETLEKPGRKHRRVAAKGGPQSACSFENLGARR